jgi:hypothetical protein
MLNRLVPVLRQLAEVSGQFGLVAIAFAACAPTHRHSGSATEALEVHHLFSVQRVYTTTWIGKVEVLLSDDVLSQPVPGRYVLVDVTGRVGDAQLDLDLVRGWNKSSHPPFHIELDWISAPTRSPEQSGIVVVAVGPLRETLPHARLLRIGSAADHPGQVERVGPRDEVKWAVDLDGDGKAEVVSYASRQELGMVEPDFLGWRTTAETWQLRRGHWERIELCSWESGTLVGP